MAAAALAASQGPCILGVLWLPTLLVPSWQCLQQTPFPPHSQPHRHHHAPAGLSHHLHHPSANGSTPQAPAQAPQTQPTSAPHHTQSSARTTEPARACLVSKTTHSGQKRYDPRPAAQETSAKLRPHAWRRQGAKPRAHRPNRGPGCFSAPASGLQPGNHLSRHQILSPHARPPSPRWIAPCLS